MILIIAYGNKLREDDGAGFALARRLERSWHMLGTRTRRTEAHQLTPELALEIVEPAVTAVIFADARVAQAKGSEPVQVRPIDRQARPSPGLAHHLDPAALMAYAGLLDGRVEVPAWLVTVPGHSFGYGDTLSEGARSAIDQAFKDEGGDLRRLIARLAANPV